MPSVNDPYHDRLEEDANAVFQDCDYVTDSATYHDVMRPEVVEFLRFIDTNTGLYTRTRSDRIAVHRTKKEVIQYECKTRPHKNRDLCIEALPLAIHSCLARNFSVDCLYVCRDLDGDYGFWCSEMPEIINLVLTKRGAHFHQMLINEFVKSGHLDQFDVDVYRDRFATFQAYQEAGLTVPRRGSRIFNETSNRGSGDPYVFMIKAGLMKWQDLIGEGTAAVAA